MNNHGSRERFAPASISYSTAYSGSEGLITDSSVQSSAIESAYQDDFNFYPTESPARTTPPIGSRLLSSFSNTQPAAAALKRSSTVLHSRARSLASYVPRLNNSSTPSTEERSEKSQLGRSSIPFGDLFNGESAPIRLGVPPSSPSKEETCEFIMEYQPSFTDRPRGPSRQNTSQSTGSTNNNRKSWFARKLAPASPSIRPIVQEQQDHLASFNIHDALFPHGPADPLSPHAFNDLLMNATSLLQKMQVAYKEKVDYIASIKPEIDAQKEEVEEAETRAQHLKLQLEDMSRKATEHQLAMKEMSFELSNARMQRQELEYAVTRPNRASNTTRTETYYTTDGNDAPRSRKRTSGGSTSDSGFESDFDNETFSIASGRPSSPSTSIAPSIDERSFPDQEPFRSMPARSAPFRAQTVNRNKRIGGGDAAWEAVDSLRNENYDLRKQLEEMDRTLQGCIDFVGAVQI